MTPAMYRMREALEAFKEIGDCQRCQQLSVIESRPADAARLPPDPVVVRVGDRHRQLNNASVTATIPNPQ